MDIITQFFESEYFNESSFGAPKDSDNYDIECGVHATDYHTGQHLGDFDTIRDAARWAWETDTDCPKHSNSKTFTNLNCKNILDAACGMEDRDDREAHRMSANACKWEIDFPEYLSDDRAESYLLYHGKFERSAKGRAAARQYVAQKKAEKEAEKQAAIQAALEAEKKEKARRHAARMARLAAQRAEEERIAQEKWDREAPERARKEKMDAIIAKIAQQEKEQRLKLEQPHKEFVDKYVRRALKQIDRPTNRLGDTIMSDFGCERTWGWPRRGMTPAFKDAISKADDKLRAAVRAGRYTGDPLYLEDYYKNLEKVAHTLGLDESIETENLVDKFLEQMDN